VDRDEALEKDRSRYEAASLLALDLPAIEPVWPVLHQWGIASANSPGGTKAG
jgi:hypothetical protein